MLSCSPIKPFPSASTVMADHRLRLPSKRSRAVETHAGVDGEQM
jgi:hypothetical protein